MQGLSAGPGPAYGWAVTRNVLLFLLQNTKSLPYLQVAPEAVEVQQPGHTSNHNGSQRIEGHQLKRSGQEEECNNDHSTGEQRCQSCSGRWAVSYSAAVRVQAALSH